MWWESNETVHSFKYLTPVPLCQAFFWMFLEGAMNRAIKAFSPVEHPVHFVLLIT
jgi:hypothetical protein